ncbi:hypothetical protein ES705_36216 [subsurface metagenome]
MGFLQRGFAWGNKRGFAAKMLSPELLIRLITFTVRLLGGGGRVADQTTKIIDFGKVVGLGSYPDAVATYLGVDLTTFQLASGGGGGKTEQTTTIMTAAVVLSLGSYP